MSDAIKGLENIEDIEKPEEEIPVAKPKDTDKIQIEFPKDKGEEEIKTEPEIINRPVSERIEDIMSIIRAVSGGASVDSRIDPILRPKNWKTTSILTKGEIQQILALIAFCKTSPEETECVLEYCEDLCYLKLSESGFAIEKAIDLGKALSEKIITGLSSPEKPTDGMKSKGK